MAVTIKDVARRAGVNPSTVSRAIHNHSAISEKTKERVRKAMADLDYSRNSAAQMLASGKSGAIGVIFPPIENKSEQPFFMKILTAINEEAHQNKITVSIASGHTIEELLSQVRVMYQEKRVDGFIVLYKNDCFQGDKALSFLNNAVDKSTILGKLHFFFSYENIFSKFLYKILFILRKIALFILRKDSKI